MVRYSAAQRRVGLLLLGQGGNIMPDWKPRKRIKDPKVMRDMHAAGVQCVLCAKRGSLHHVLPRSRGGDDVYENLIGLCGSGTTGHHGLVEAYDLDTRNDIGSWLLSERPDIIDYVKRRLGDEEGAAWLERKYLL